MAEYYTKLFVKLNQEVDELKLKARQLNLEIVEREAVCVSVREMCIKNGVSEWKILELIKDHQRDH